MAYQDEEYPEQPLWQSVLVFCCKGMIEGIVVLLFVWLLVQVLFTKDLEVHLIFLLGVGLAVFCLSLVLGCVLCWCCRRVPQPQDKESVMSFPLEPGDHVSPSPTAEPLSLSPSVDATSIKQEYEELDGDTLELPSPFSCSTPSETDSAHLPFIPRPRAASEMNEHPKSFFPLRRLGTSTASSSKVMVHSRSSLPSLPRLGLFSMTRRALERHCTVTSDSFLHSERTRLTSPILSTPSTDSVFQPQVPPQELSLPHYGSNSSCPKAASQMSFTLLFSPANGTLTVHILSLSGVSQGGMGRVSVHASLPPLCPAPLQVLIRQPSLSPDFQSQSFVLQVGSVEELRRCTLHMAVFIQDLSGLREVPQGELELLCGEVDWELDHTITCTKELSPAKYRLKKAWSSLDATSQRGLASTPRVSGQLFILLQYQALAHRIKVMVHKAENLTKLTRMPGAPDHYVIINLRHEGTVITTNETKGAGGCNAVWNTPFLFDLPPGDVSQLSIVLEFIVMQGRVYSKRSMLGRVLIGREAPEVGQAHWRDMCSQEQVETARWHTIQP
ncbi:synaptotagmin-5-like [Megalops cyprinoides]|uniref:synaptotagmin-5-like n=1 Tax=Megalops cyprinoides TaxID=118141 RepID=UPI001864713F|nr:synaptotagmin-5-like [Megalops cyprinoides]